MLNSQLYGDELVSGYSTWLLSQILYVSEQAELEYRQRDVHTGAVSGIQQVLFPSLFSWCILDPSSGSQLRWRKSPSSPSHLSNRF